MSDDKQQLVKIQKLFDKKIIKVERLSKGITNDNYKCTLKGDDKYVVRFPGVGSEYLVNRLNEHNVIEDIKKLSIDINTIYFNTETGIKITRYIENSSSLCGNLNEVIKIGVEKLKQIHTSGIIFKNQFNSLLLIFKYIRVCKTLNIEIDENYNFLIGKLRQIKNSSIFNSRVFVSCHNDPVPENFLITSSKKIFLIDWEYGGMNDHVWDLAGFSLEMNLTEEQEQKFLFTYYESDLRDDELQHKILFYKICQDLLWFLWSKIKIHFGQNLREYALMRYNRGQENFLKLIELLNMSIEHNFK